MDQLKYLWNLECDINMFIEKKEQLECLETNLLVKDKEREIDFVENEILMLNKKKLDLEKKIYDSEKKIKDLEYDIKINNDGLYGGKINDIKQLEFLSHQKEDLKAILDKKEIETLNLYENKDILEDDLSIGLEKLSSLKLEKENIENINKAKVLSIKEEISILNKKIKDDRSKIKKNILDQYAKIKKRKKKAVVMAKDSICLGCNMKLSSGMWDNIKHSEEPILCDSCGRILYYINDENN